MANLKISIIGPDGGVKSTFESKPGPAAGVLAMLATEWGTGVLQDSAGVRIPASEDRLLPDERPFLFVLMQGAASSNSQAGAGAGAAAGSTAAVLEAVRQWLFQPSPGPTTPEGATAAQRWGYAHIIHALIITACCAHEVYVKWPMTPLELIVVLRMFKFAVGFGPPDRWEVTALYTDWVVSVLAIGFQAFPFIMLAAMRQLQWTREV